ncbi:MAG TPA: zf-HC2 domain-containing protein [Candidatus Eisenbacteria bacterium]|nr:zf-HC2 domain-containing protein [Candidatus Eisenbacteria bacterium]
MRSCVQARRLFHPYWDDEITQAEREWLEGHFAGCGRCRAEYETLARTLESVATLPRHEASPELVERVLAAARRASPAPDRIAVAAAPPRWMPVAAAATVLLLLAGTLAAWFAAPGRPPGMVARREAPIVEPRLVAAAPRAGAPAPHATLSPDSLFDHSEDVELVLDPVTLSRGRAQATPRTAARVQGEQAVISF